MKQRNLKKKAGALLLAAAMTVNLFPAFRTEVHAAELPDNTQFATVEELKAFDTDDTDADGANPAKVYFGNNNQQWWIAGSQNGNLTLFAASPLATGQVFESNYSSNKPYNAGWGCDYTSGSAPKDVYPNHYGASPLRTTLRNLESSNFTDAEQNLMNTTTIYTNDTKNSSVYSTSEKLYLAYGDYNDQYITVGTNASNTLNGGLRIDKGYWGSGDFWLRAPYMSIGHGALAAWPGYYVSIISVNIDSALVPAFELNLSSVIFASAAPAAVSDGALTLADTDGDGAFTMRYSAGNLGSAQITYDYTTVDLSGVPSGAYLVAQNKDGAWAKAASGTTSVSASDMGIGSFENCKVWLETTDSSERKTYATVAKKEWYDVNVTGNSTLNITSNNGIQNRVKIGNAIADIIVKANSGYYFSDEYVTELNQQLGGLTVEKSDDFTLKISGTPRSDVTITLPDATKYYAVNVTLGTGMQVQSGSLTQKVDDGESMTALVIEAGSGYMFPADYSVAAQSGITVTSDSGSQITVSGTPTADVNLTLPAATQKAYGMELSGNGTFGSVCVGYASDKTAAQEFTIKNTGNVDLTNVQVTVDGTDSTSFALAWDNTATSIQPNGTIKVTVKPKDSLAVKEYQAQLSVSADNCNTASKTLQFTVAEHAYNDVVTPPTCTQKGYTTHTCQNCGNTYTDSETNKIPHDFGDWKTIQSPTCEQGGSRQRVCKVCQYIETENLNPNGHEWEDTYTVDKEPTCQSDGSQSIHCKNCDAAKDSQIISRVGHKYTNYVSNHDATCTKDGTKTASCDFGCGNTDTLPDDGSMLEHDYEWTYNNDAACEKNGTETGVCKDCGDKTTREKAGTALEHQPGGWIIDKEATATTDGEKHKECTVCGKVLETETITATGTPGGRYKILEGADQTWKGSGSLTIKANGDFAKFTGIKVDGTVVDVSHYDAKSGSTVVTLKESYLATLSAGVHTLTFVYNDGEVSTRFMIADKETSGTPETPDNSTKDNQNTGNRTDTGSSRSPQTGDKTNISLYLLLLLMSGLMIAFCVEWKKIKSKC